jgi:hypothetical protein
LAGCLAVGTLETMEIQAGTLLDCETARGGHVNMRALGGVIQGYDFPVVWVCTEKEYARAQETDSKPDGIPWPYSALQVAEATQDVA